ncbi:MAG: cyclase [Myxococcota bacterium]
MAFEYRFQVKAPVAAVRAFHGSTEVLRELTPPGTWVQIHRFGALEDGMEAEFTLWLGPIPIRWHALHRDVDAFGFTDVQVQGPMARWEHTHRFVSVDENTTEVREHIELEHPRGLRGVWTRLLFGGLALRGLFAYRAWVTRRKAPAFG